MKVNTDLQVMVDIETQSTASNARIIQIGACTFYRTEGDDDAVEIVDDFKVNVSTDIGHVDRKTIDWWKSQKASSPGLEVSLSIPEPVDLYEALSLYKKFCKGASCQWSHGSSFDCVILENSYKELPGLTSPFRFWEHRDTRTIYETVDPEELAKQLSEKAVTGDKHDALVDCYRQTYRLQYCYRALAGL